MTLWAHNASLQVTKVKMEQKQKEGIAEARGGQRGPVSQRTHQCILHLRTASMH